MRNYLLLAAFATALAHAESPSKFLGTPKEFTAAETETVKNEAPAPAKVEAPAKAEKKVIAVYKLEGPLTESGVSDPSLGSLLGKNERPLTAFDITCSIEKAAKDPAVKAIVLEVDSADLNLSQIQEIRRHLLAARAAGKDVWLYSEYLSNATALLGSAANHFALMPEATCEFSGIHAESMYFKGLLDKVGVQADVIHIGDFKSFGEMFYRTGPSEYAQKQEDELLDSIFNQIVGDVASGRKLKDKAVRDLIDRGELSAEEAQKGGLADELLYRTEFNDKLYEVYGEDADFDSGYHLPDVSGPEIKGMMDFFKLLFKDDSKNKTRKDYVAVVALEGDITDESVADVRAQIIKLIDDDHAKALVLRVDSPGGSAMASEVLWEATEQWKACERPFVVSMGGVAASGGYYVASGADRIFAEGGTITGSIGVVGMKFVLSGAMEKIGITTHSTERGKYAGAMSMTKAYTPDEATLVRNSMNRVYGVFKQHVEEGRKGKLKGPLESLAGGRVYSGKRALEIGLVDELGGLTDSIAYAASQAKIPATDVKLVPEPKSPLDGMFAKPEESTEIIRAGTSKKNGISIALKSLGATDAMPTPLRQSVIRLGHRLDSFSGHNILLLGPDLHIDMK